MTKIVVTGATGELGKLVVKHLLEKVPANQIAVSVRSVEKASALADLGIEVRYGDFNDPASMEQSFAGASKLLLVSTPPEDDSIRRIRKHVLLLKQLKKLGLNTSSTRVLPLRM